MLSRIEQEIRETLDVTLYEMRELREDEQEVLGMQILSFLRGINENGHLGKTVEEQRYYDGLYIPAAGRLHLRTDDDKVNLVKFRPLEGELMNLLTQYPGQLVPKDTIILAIWGQYALNTSITSAYNTLVYRTRKQIEPYQNTVWIITEAWRGLIFTGNVRICQQYHPLLFDPKYKIGENGERGFELSNNDWNHE